MSVECESKDGDETKPFWEDPGLTKYTNPDNPGFNATFKASPEDFLVTELLDIEGRHAVLDNFESPEDRGCSSLVFSSGKIKKDNYLAPVLVSQLPLLQDLISDEQYELLKELALNYKKTGTPDPVHQIDLGSVEDKQKRAHIHGAVRVAFPVLMTTVKRDLEDTPCILVQKDPKYTKLLTELTMEEAEKILVFMAVKSSDRAFMKLADRPKDKRTKIHHLLDILYGKSLTTKYVRFDKVPPSCDQDSAADADAAAAESPMAKRPKMEEGVLDSVQPSGYIKVWKTWWQRAGDGEKSSKQPNFYVNFVLKKRLVETHHAIQLISDAVNCSLTDIRTHGLKDKIGITTQVASVKNVRPDKLLSSRPALLEHGIDVGNYKYTTEHVQRGGHSGNHFSITLKDLSLDSGDNVEGVVHRALESIKENGFVNYFGLQRLGGMNVPASRVGLAILKNNWKEAVKIMLTGRISIQEELKELVEKEQYREVADMVPGDCVLDHLVLKSLIRFQGSGDHAYLKALQNIPHDSFQFFMQSFTSLAWNHLASYRLLKYGPNVVEGDLVVKGYSAKWWESPRGSNVRYRSQLHSVSAEEEKEGVYHLHHVVLPTMGTGFVMPKNEVGDKLLELMAMAGIALTSFRKNRLKLHARTTYRHLLAYPRNLTWSFMKNPPPSCQHQQCSPVAAGRSVSTDQATEAAAPTAATDKTSLQNESCEITDETVAADDHSVNVSTSEEGSVPDGPSAEGAAQSPDLPSLSINFDLGRNIFATMLVRELIKRNL